MGLTVTTERHIEDPVLQLERRRRTEEGAKRKEEKRKDDKKRLGILPC